jgi:hypothetical protein
MRAIRTARLTITVYLCLVSLVSNAQQSRLAACPDQGNWSKQNFVVGADTVDITTPLLLTDGRVMVQYRGGLPGGHRWQDWYALTPGTKGCYSLSPADCGGAGLVATWKEMASLTTITSPTVPAYGPNAFASAVLPDGNVIIEGGESNLSLTPSESTGGAYYDAVEDTWTHVPHPSGWMTIGDAPATVLANGTFMLGNACGNDSGVGETALFNEATRPFSWTNTPGQPPEWTAEASFTLLPDHSVVFVGTCWPGHPSSPTCSTLNNDVSFEAYDPSTGLWDGLANTPVQLYSYDSMGGTGANSCTPGGPGFGEQGPAALLPNGQYFATGGYNVQANAMLTSAYDTKTRTWANTPPLPSVMVGGVAHPLGAEDQGAVVLTDGNLLLATAAGFTKGEVSSGPVYYIEWNGNSYCQLDPVPAGTPFQSEMLTLPTGQIFITDISWDPTPNKNYFIYTPKGTTYPGIAPTLTHVSSATLVQGSTYTVRGTQFNGATQSSFFGDDFQNYTNYPLVRITNKATGDVFYAKTHDPNTMGVATGPHKTTTSFDIPMTAELGASTLVVVTNGIPSNSLVVDVKPKK